MDRRAEIIQTNGASRPRRLRRRHTTAPPRPTPPMLQEWLQAQATNVARHVEALRPFPREEFGNGPAAPTEGHTNAVNDLMTSLRGRLLNRAARVTRAVQ